VRRRINCGVNIVLASQQTHQGDGFVRLEEVFTTVEPRADRPRRVPRRRRGGGEFTLTAYQTSLDTRGKRDFRLLPSQGTPRAFRGYRGGGFNQLARGNLPDERKYSQREFSGNDDYEAHARILTVGFWDLSFETVCSDLEKGRAMDGKGGSSSIQGGVCV